MPQKTKKSPRDENLQANVVGRQLRKFRLAAGLTQNELSQLCALRGLELTRGTLAKIECQVRFVKACELFIIAMVLGVPVERFYPAGFGLPQK